MLSSSDGDVGTLRIVSFRPSDEPMPIDARDRIETESGNGRTWVCPCPSEKTMDAQLAAGGWYCCWCSSIVGLDLTDLTLEQRCRPPWWSTPLPSLRTPCGMSLYNLVSNWTVWSTGLYC